MDKDNPVRFIDAFIDSLNMEKLGFKHSIPTDVGRPSYNPSDLLKLYLYGYLNQVRSSRKLERECHRNLEVMWLMRNSLQTSKPSPTSEKTTSTASKAFSENSLSSASA